MVALKHFILLTDDNEISSQILNINSNDFQITSLTFDKGLLEIAANKFDISAIIFDAHDQNNSVETVYKELRCTLNNKNIPILFICQDNESLIKEHIKHESVTEFIRLPINAEVLESKLKWLVLECRFYEFKKLINIQKNEFDELTGIYNKSTYFEKTQLMLKENQDKSFIIIKFDIDHFGVFNTYYGMPEGDNLLKYIARCLIRYSKQESLFTFGRIEQDIFSVCMPFNNKKDTSTFIDFVNRTFKSYNQNINILPCFGAFIIADNNMSVNLMYEKANIAAKNCKGNYFNNFLYYEDQMERAIIREQELNDSIKLAIENNEFKIYFQPKCNLQTGYAVGAEALVRWIHPEKGFISPSTFIPTFEKNGFIVKLDFYVFEEVCKIISGWIHDGREVYPVSVNISRITLYNPGITNKVCDIVDKYNIPHSVFNIEITESAYSDNPEATIQTVEKLQEKGFIIFMDDFGSAYSSLNMLKDMKVDILKLDLKFLSKTKDTRRGENIITSIIQMAKSLNTPVVAEGVETKSQVDFLFEIGCQFAQGYYFAKPMTAKEYEEYMDNTVFKPSSVERVMDRDIIWSGHDQEYASFSDATVAKALCEYSKDTAVLIRMNNLFHETTQCTQSWLYTDNIINKFATNSKPVILNMLKSVAKSKDVADCEVEKLTNTGTIWLHLSAKYLTQKEKSAILILTAEDITTNKLIKADIERHELSLRHHRTGINKMMIIDNYSRSRDELLEIFKNEYDVYPVSNGNEAIEMLKMKHIHIILLNTIIPDISIEKFIDYHNSSSKASKIPLIIITNSDSVQSQKTALKYAANDYIAKPFIKEIVLRRVNNVLFSYRHIKNKIDTFKLIEEKDNH